MLSPCSCFVTFTISKACSSSFPIIPSNMYKHYEVLICYLWAYLSVLWQFSAALSTFLQYYSGLTWVRTLFWIGTGPILAELQSSSGEASKLKRQCSQMGGKGRKIWREKVTTWIMVQITAFLTMWRSVVLRPIVHTSPLTPIKRSTLACA